MNGRRLVWISFDVTGRACVEAAATAGAEVVGIVTLPGPVRTEVSGMCAFDETAAKLGARLIKADDANASGSVDAVRELAPDMIWVVGWSQLLRAELLAIPPRGTYGMHPTLLPRHRGRAPIPWAILTGLARTGVTLFEIADATADSGAIIGQEVIEIAPDETATTLFAKVDEAHVALVRRLLPAVLDGTAPRVAQDSRRASAWTKRTPADGIIDWETRASHLDAWVRALTHPYPGAFTWLGDTRLVVWRARAVPTSAAAPAGTVLGVDDEGAVVACGEGALLLQDVGPAGDRLRTLTELLHPGDVLG